MDQFKQLIDAFKKQDRRALARVITLVENRDQSLRAIVRELYPLTGQAFVLGITGPPGAGKSTVTDRLVSQIRKTGKTVAVVAVDPSSPFSGGAILGDRIRMQSHTEDSGVYIRSLGTRGTHGGLSGSTREVVMILDAAGFDWIIVETAGVGQTELEIMKLAHAVTVVLVPESGDGIQVMKAGLMEIADLFVVNKCDRPEADKLVREIVTMIGLSDEVGDPQGRANLKWKIPVAKTEALHDRGVGELFTEIQKFREFASKQGVFRRRREVFIRQEIEEIIIRKLGQIMERSLDSPQGRNIFDAVLQKQENPYDAADSLFRIITEQKMLK